ncbi:MAG: glycosyltransferase family 9 protein [Chlorobium sp.]|nr:MAG: glycosyltransferase family 9 protein [Chlorobium sp.]
MKSVKTILVIRLSSIGDIVLTTPVLRSLEQLYPQARIDYCTKAPFVPLLASNPRLSSIHTPEQPPAGSCDLVVDLQNNLRSHAIVRSLKAAHVVRYRKENWKKWLLVQFGINFDRRNRSVVDRYRDALQEPALPDDPDGCELYLSPAERSYAAPYFEGSAGGTKTLALCFGANHFTKRFPPKRFASLLSLLQREEPLQVLLLGGKEDAPHALEIMNALSDSSRSKVLNLAGCCSLMQSAALLERSDAVLCNDTGLMHIASAFRKKLFVLFGSSSPAFGFLPYNSDFELFEVEGLRCRPCSHIGRDRCPKGHFRCMNDLSENLIAKKILDHFRQSH